MTNFKSNFEKNLEIMNSIFKGAFSEGLTMEEYEKRYGKNDSLDDINIEEEKDDN